MLYIQKAIKKVIERFIVNMIPTTDNLSIGATTIPVESSRRYEPYNTIVIYNKPSSNVQAEGEVHKIIDIPNRNSIVIDNPLVENYPLTNTYVEKMIGYESGNESFLEAVYIGNPAVIPRYPAITIDSSSRSSEWMTLESTSETYNLEITVYVTEADYQTQYELMHAYVKGIENALFRSFYPLVEPYDITTLAENMGEFDTQMKVTDDSVLSCEGWIWFESYDFLRVNKIKEYLGNNVYRLAFPASRNFESGDNVIKPRRHVYNTLPASTKYGTVNKDTILKAATISYTVQEEVRRYTPMIDPLTF